VTIRNYRIIEGGILTERQDKIYSRIGIYGIKNVINNKIYIGKTGMNFGDRWDNHRALLRSNKHDNQHLQHAWNKYGENNFEFIVIEDCDVNQLNAREKYWITYYKDVNLAYNIQDGGDGGQFLGKHLSEETKRKIGAKNKINMLGKKHSEDTKKKMRESHLGKKYNPMSEEGRQHVKEAQQKYALENPKKLTKDDVIHIREERNKQKTTYADLAKKYNVTSQCISDICNYKRWKNI
jgi:group I intron endonuclease